MKFNWPSPYKYDNQGGEDEVFMVSLFSLFGFQLDKNKIIFLISDLRFTIRTF